MNDNDLINYLRETGYDDVLLAAVEQGSLTNDVTSQNGDVISLSEAGTELERLGLVYLDERLAGTIVEANGRGKQIAKRIQQSRETGEERWDAVTRAIAHALIEAPGSGEWRVEEVDGRPVTDGERHVVHSRLELWQCAKGTKAWGGEFVRLDPLPRVHEIPGVQGSLLRHFQPGSSSSLDQSTHTSTTFGDGNTVGAVMTGSHGSTQTGTITTLEQGQILAGIGQVRAAMGDDAQPQLIEAVNAIETEARSESATKASIGQQVQSALITAGATAASTEVFQGLTNLLSLALG